MGTAKSNAATIAQRYAEFWQMKRREQNRRLDQKKWDCQAPPYLSPTLVWVAASPGTGKRQSLPTSPLHLHLQRKHFGDLLCWAMHFRPLVLPPIGIHPPQNGIPFGTRGANRTRYSFRPLYPVVFPTEASAAAFVEAMELVAQEGKIGGVFGEPHPLKSVHDPYFGGQIEFWDKVVLGFFYAPAALSDHATRPYALYGLSGHERVGVSAATKAAEERPRGQLLTRLADLLNFTLYFAMQHRIINHKPPDALRQAIALLDVTYMLEGFVAPAYINRQRKAPPVNGVVGDVSWETYPLKLGLSELGLTPAERQEMSRWLYYLVYLASHLPIGEYGGFWYNRRPPALGGDYTPVIYQNPEYKSVITLLFPREERTTAHTILQV